MILEFDDHTLSFNDYINGNYGKFVITITKQQYAINITNKPHECIYAELVPLMRPDLKVDGLGRSLIPGKDFRFSNIVISGFQGYISVELPRRDLLSEEQFECFKDILLTIKDFNQNNHLQYEVLIFSQAYDDLDSTYYENNIDGLIDKLSEYIATNPLIEDETIVGIPLNKLDKKVSYA